MEEAIQTHLPTRILKFAKHWCAVACLPALLVLVFVAQNAAFVDWLHIVPDFYDRMYAAAFALGVLLYGPAVFLKPRGRYLYLAVVSMFVSALFLAEYLYFSYDGGYLQITALELTSQSGAVTGTALRLLSPRLAFFVLDLILVAGFFWMERHRRLTPISLSLGGKALAVVIILASVFGGYETLLAAERKTDQNYALITTDVYDLNSVVGKMGVVNYFLEDAARRILASGQVTGADRAFVDAWASTRPAPSAPGSDFGIAKGRNLIFIQVESLENAVINRQVGGQEITPNLNQLASEGEYFSNYFTQVGMGNTADAEFVTLNSLYPLPDSVAFVDHAQNTYAALPQLLVDHGYNTNVFHGDVPTFWNRADIYPNLGYQNWYMKDSYTVSTPIGITGVGDQDLFEQSLPKIETLKQPFMATLITLSSHTPFILPQDLQTLAIPPNSGLNDTQVQYLQSIHYADAAIGDFINQLKQTPLYGNSLIVIFGDHGSYTDISSALGDEKDDVADMSASQVPLIILAPGTGLHGVATLPASHLDVFPTVSDLLGITPPASVLGVDVLNASSTPVVVSRKSGTGGVNAIVGPSLIYVAAADGVFGEGSCLEASTRSSVPIEHCREMYDRQSAIVRVSDTVVRGNLVGDLLAP